MGNIISKLSTNLNARPPTPIPNNLINEACQGVEDWINKITKPFTSKVKDPFLGDTPSEESLKRLISKFKKKIMKISKRKRLRFQQKSAKRLKE